MPPTSTKVRPPAPRNEMGEVEINCWEATEGLSVRGSEGKEVGRHAVCLSSKHQLDDAILESRELVGEEEANVKGGKSRPGSNCVWRQF